MQPDIITSTFWFSVLGFVVVWILVPRIQHWNYARAMEVRTASGAGQPVVSRLGGVALVLAFVGISVAAQIWLPAADAAKAKTRWVIIATSLAMFLLGLWDDIKPLGARKKLAGQALAGS